MAKAVPCQISTYWPGHGWHDHDTWRIFEQMDWKKKVRLFSKIPGDYFIHNIRWRDEEKGECFCSHWEVLYIRCDIILSRRVKRMIQRKDIESVKRYFNNRRRK